MTNYSPARKEASDGKPLYQRTVTGVAPNTSKNGTDTTGTIGNVIDNIDSIISLNGVIKYSSGNVLTLPWTTNAGYMIKLGFSDTDSKVMIVNGASSYNGAPVITTIQYTKTTD